MQRARAHSNQSHSQSATICQICQGCCGRVDERVNNYGYFVLLTQGFSTETVFFCQGVDEPSSSGKSPFILRAQFSSASDSFITHFIPPSDVGARVWSHNSRLNAPPQIISGGRILNCYFSLSALRLNAMLNCSRLSRKRNFETRSLSLSLNIINKKVSKESFNGRSRTHFG